MRSVFLKLVLALGILLTPGISHAGPKLATPGPPAAAAPDPGPDPETMFSLETDREPMASLDGQWRFHPGDDPRWADPRFDDSQWPLVRSGKDWDEIGYHDLNGIAWYRFRVTL
ncbi:MAG TPA: hypothetical protein VKV02_10265, partial [Acidobacteriaceae bacterium]|nr:hypothetical protein [Acidobacteriaceae bacterium]